MSGNKSSDKDVQNVVKKVKVFTEHFVDYFDTIIIVYHLIYEKTKQLPEKKVIKLPSGLPITHPIKTLKEAAGNLNNILQKYGVEKPKNTTTIELAKWINYVNNASQLEIRKSIIKIALDIFQSYEKQFVEKSENELEPLAKEAAEKIIKHFLANECQIIDDKLVAKSIPNFDYIDKSITETCLNKMLSNVFKFTPEKKIRASAKFYTSTGINVDGKLYKNKNFKEKYGYRRLFKEEIKEEVLKDYDVAGESLDYEYLATPEMKEMLVEHLRNRNGISNSIIDGIKQEVIDDVEAIKKNYFLDIFEELYSLMELYEGILSTEDHEKPEDKNDNPEPTPGSKITTVSNNKISQWNSTF